MKGLRRLLILEDDESHALLIERAFAGNSDYTVEVASNLEAARKCLAHCVPDLILADLNLPDGRATDLLHDHPDGPPMVVMTSHGDESFAVTAMKAGALDYVVKTPESFREMVHVVHRAEREAALLNERRAAKRALAAKSRELEAMNQRLLRLMSVAKSLPTAQGIDACIGLFVRLLGEELHAASSQRVALDLLVGELGLAEQELCVLRHGGPARHVDEQHSALLVPISVPRSETPEGVCVRRSPEEPFSDADATIAELLASYLAEVLKAQHSAADYRESQAQLLEAQKLRSIGQLAGGLAHDLNNMLMGIMGASELIRRHVDASCPEAAKYVGVITDATARASELTKNLLTYSRRSQLTTELLDLPHLVTTVVELLRHTLDKRIAIRVETAAERCFALADATMLQNAVLNVCINARDAMPDGGTLTITTEILDLDEDFCRLHIPGGTARCYACVRISDTGHGMTPDTLQRVFDPFFTTKALGNGTGLGMSVVFGTMRDHHGAVLLESQPGQGTVCRLVLPLADGTPIAKPSGNALKQIGRRLRILMAEDETLNRQTIAAMLERCGHLVDAVKDGNEVVEQILNGRQEYDLLLLDIMMPTMSGIEAYQRLIQLDRELPAVFLSGLTHQGSVVGKLPLGSFCEFVPKPCSISDLQRAMRKCMRAWRDA